MLNSNKIILIFFSFLVISCASKKKLTGKYQIKSENGKYILDIDRKSYIIININGSSVKGKFKIISLSSERSFLIFNDLILRKNSNLIKDLNEKGDSINVGIEHSFRKLGSTIFEINTQNKDSLKYRKTYSNQIDKTELRGDLIRFN